MKLASSLRWIPQQHAQSDLHPRRHNVPAGLAAECTGRWASQRTILFGKGFGGQAAVSQKAGYTRRPKLSSFATATTSRARVGLQIGWTVLGIRLRSVNPNPSRACFEHDTPSHDRHRVYSPGQLRQRVCTMRYSRCTGPRCLDEAGRAVQVDTDHGRWANPDCRYGESPGRSFG